MQVVRNNQQEGGKFFTVGEMYFNLPQLQTKLEQIGRVTKDGEKKLQAGATEYRSWIGILQGGDDGLTNNFWTLF